jgi:hypothetical protein
MKKSNSSPTKIMHQYLGLRQPYCRFVDDSPAVEPATQVHFKPTAAGCFSVKR